MNGMVCVHDAPTKSQEENLPNIKNPHRFIRKIRLPDEYEDDEEYIELIKEEIKEKILSNEKYSDLWGCDFSVIELDENKEEIQIGRIWL